MKDIPTFAEAGVPNFEATFWYGLLAPARTPAAVIAKLNREMTAALADSTVIQQLETRARFPRRLRRKVLRRLSAMSWLNGRKSLLKRAKRS